MKCIYIAGPMRGMKDFNFPAFHVAAKVYRARGWEVFNPAERDERLYGADIFKSPTGNLDDLGISFNRREALAEDTNWICRFADAMHMLRGWETSGGALAEWMLGKTLRLDFYYD